MTDWDNFVNFTAATDIAGDIQGVDGPRFLKYFPFPENLPGKTTPPGFNFYDFKTVAELNKAIQSGQNVEPESMTAKLKYMIAIAKMNISLKSDQDRMVRLYEQGMKKNNWIPFYEYYYSIKSEIDTQKKLLISLQQLFERRSSLTQTNYKEEKDLTFNPVWDEVRFRLKGGSKISTFMNQVKEIMLSPNKNPPPVLANVRTAINLCETADNQELINQYLSWPYIDFNEVPCGSLDAWSDYTSFRFENLLEKNDQAERLLKTIATSDSSQTALIRSLFIQPLSSLFESARIDECMVDSPIERFNTIISNAGVQWYASIKDNKPQGIRLTHFSNMKYYLHYCLVNMGNSDKAGFFGWLQVLYFLGCDVVYSLQDLASQIRDKLEIYLEEHEGEKSNVKPVLDYLDAIDARLDDFLEFWVNRMRTQYGLVAPAGLENDPSWEMGFHEFDMNIMTGGKRRKDSRRGNNRSNYNRDLKNKDMNKIKNKKVKIAGGIPCYIVCHQVEGTRLWPLEPLPEAIITTVKDTKSAFSGLYTTVPLSQFTSTLSAPIAASSAVSSAAQSGTPVLSTFDLTQAKTELTTIGTELSTLKTDANLGAIDALITGNYATYAAMFEALVNINGSLL